MLLLRAAMAFLSSSRTTCSQDIFPNFNPDVEGSTLARLWSEDHEDFIASKLQHKLKYEERIREIFIKSKESYIESRDDEPLN